MGERKGQNKYYPPDFDYKVHKSLAGYHGQHPLRERAKKINQGILVIRFEMPYNIWCGGCGIHIAMGVRYNAEKSRIGNYYTTPIYKFRMKCHLCDNYFEIKTDPANHDYVIIEGARRKEQRWDPKENEQIVPDDKASQKKLATDAMYKLEHGADDKEKIKKAVPGLHDLSDRQSMWKEDYMINKALRKQFRDEKKAINTAAEADRSLLEKSSLEISLVPEHKDDIKMASLLKYQNIQSFDEKQQQIRREIESRPIFSTESTSSSPSTSDATESKRSVQLARKKLGLIPAAQSPFSHMKSGPQNITPFSPSSLGIVRKKSKNSDKKKEECSPTDDPMSPVSCVSSPSASAYSSSASSLSSLSLPTSPSSQDISTSLEGKQLVGDHSGQINANRTAEVCVTSPERAEAKNIMTESEQILMKKNALNSLMSNYESSNESGSDSS